jgi:hypothetical protein
VKYSLITAVGCILAACMAAPAQEGAAKNQKPLGARGAPSAALQARQADVTREVRAAAAAAQFAAIKSSMAELLFDHQSQPGLGDLDATDLDKEVARFQEDEILRAIAVQLESFVTQYPDLGVANAARAVLAHIYVHLEQPAKAVPVLREFDLDGATTHDILSAVLAMPQLEGMAARMPAMLEAIVVKPVPVHEKFAAVFVAVRLDMVDLAKRMIVAIEQGAKTIEDQAAVLLEEADLVARLMLPEPLPIDPSPVRMKLFPTDPVAAAMLSPSAVPVDDWRKIVGADAASLRETRLVDAVAFRTKALDLVKHIAPDALPGLRVMQLVPVARPVGLEDTVVQPPGIPPIEALPAMPEFIVVGLLHRAANLYPGTRAAELAAAKLFSRRLTKGTEPLDLDAGTITGGRCTLGQYRGKVVLLDFWSVANPDSMRERPVMLDLHRSYNPVGLEIISVSLDGEDSLPAVHAAVQRFRLAWPQVFEGQGVFSPIARAYDVAALPARIVIGRDGKVFALDPAELTPVRLEGTIQNALRMAPKLREDETGPLSGGSGAFRTVGVEGGVGVQPPDTSGGVIGVEPPPLPKPIGGLVRPGPIEGSTQPVGTEPASNVRWSARPVGSVGAIGGSGVVDVDVYTGPPLSGRVLMTDSLPPIYTLQTSVRVPSGGFTFQHDDTKRVGDATHVYVTLIAPSPSDQVIWVVENKELDLALGATPGSQAHVFVKYFARGGEFLSAPGYKLALSLGVPKPADIGYVGPPIRTQIVVSTTEPPTHAVVAEVDVPTSGYTFKVAEVRRGQNVTQVLLDLVPPAKGVAVMPVLQTLQASAVLGTDVVGRVEVLVRYRETDGGGSFRLAKTLQR